VIEGHNGYLVPVKAVDELVTAMENFIVNPKLITTMGKAARKLAEDKYDVHIVNQIMLEEMGLIVEKIKTIV